MYKLKNCFSICALVQMCMPAKIKFPLAAKNELWIYPIIESNIQMAQPA
jgi:hypothetical protein